VGEPAGAQTAKSTAPAASRPDQRTVAPVAPESLKETSEKERPSSAALPTTAAATGAAAKSGTVAPGSPKGEVLDQVLPAVSEKARATIHGKVRVSVKVRVDPSGGVSEAELDSPGPSKFFADLALQAARKWAFTPPEVNGKSVASEWRLRFEFTPKDTKVAPTQTAPL
jgi:TonB family protein